MKPAKAWIDNESKDLQWQVRIELVRSAPGPADHRLYAELRRTQRAQYIMTCGSDQRRIPSVYLRLERIIDRARTPHGYGWYFSVECSTGGTGKVWIPDCRAMGFYYTTRRHRDRPQIVRDFNPIFQDSPVEPPCPTS